MMQIKTKNFYDDLKFPGLYTQSSINYHLDDIKNPYLDIIDTAVKQGESVVDIGSGSGYITNLFAQRYKHKQFTAIDFADGIDFGKKFSENCGSTNTNWIKNDFLSHTFSDQFDVVICQGVFHHIEDQTNAINKIKNLCRPGGHIVFGVYHPYGKILKKWMKIDYASDILEKDQESNPFESSFTFDQVGKLFEKYKFINSYPVSLPFISNIVAFFNFRNGGLITYLYQKPL